MLSIYSQILEYKELQSWNLLPILDNCHLMFSFAYRDIELGSSHIFPHALPSLFSLPLWVSLSPQKIRWATSGRRSLQLLQNSCARYSDPKSFPISDAGLFLQVQSKAVVDFMGVTRSLTPILKDDSLPLWNVTKYEDLWLERTVGRGRVVSGKMHWHFKHNRLLWPLVMALVFSQLIPETEHQDY